MVKIGFSRNKILTAVIIAAVFIAAFFYFTVEPEIQHVVLIVIDGVRPETIMGGGAENLIKLAEEGSYTRDAWTVYPSGTLAGIPAIHTGALPEVHGVKEWHGKIHAQTLAEVFKERGKESVFIRQDSLLSNYTAAASTGIYFHPRGAEHFTDSAIELFLKHNPFFLSVYYPEPDGAGHRYGHGSDEYAQALKDVDIQIGRLMDFFKEKGIYENILFVVTTDHGMTVRSHSVSHESDFKIFSIWRGPGVKKGYEMEKNIHIEALEPGKVNVGLYSLKNNDWEENKINWRNKPPVNKKIDEVLIDYSGLYQWDITPLSYSVFMSNPVISFALLSEKEETKWPQAVFFSSKEWPRRSMHSYIEIEFENDRGYNQTIKIYPEADAMVKSEPAEENFGQHTNIFAGNYKGAKGRGYYSFNLNSLPRGVRLKKITFYADAWRLYPGGYPEQLISHRIIDIAPTVCSLLDFPPPAQASGDVIKQIMR